MKTKFPKSKQSIIETFFDIRKKKELDKITVTELCHLANINKSTFYVYYHDIIDLSEQLESALVQSILEEIDSAQNIFTNAEIFSQDLFKAYQKKEEEIHILFSGNREPLFPDKFAREIKQFLFRIYPELKDDKIINIQLNFVIYGAVYSYINNSCEEALLISTISSLVKQSLKTEEK